MMRVLKRDGRKEAVKFDKITARIEKLCYGLSEYVDPVAVAKRVVDGVYDGVTTSELDNLAAETAASMTIKPYDEGSLPKVAPGPNGCEVQLPSPVEIPDD